MSQYFLRKAEITLQDKYEAVRRFHSRKEDIASISKAYGVSHITIHGWRKTYLKEALAEVKPKPVKLAELGDAIRQAEKVDIVTKAVESEKEKAPSDDPRRKRYTEEQKSWALAELERGESPDVICDVLGLSSTSLYNWRKKAREEAAQAKAAKKEAKLQIETPAPSQAASLQATMPKPFLSVPAILPPLPPSPPLIVPTLAAQECAELKAELNALKIEHQQLKILYAEACLERMKRATP